MPKRIQNVLGLNSIHQSEQPTVSTPQDAVADFLFGGAEIGLRPFQQEVFDRREAGIIVLHWSRQIGKSFVLAAFAVDRCIRIPGRLVSVLSNSRENGAEFLEKCREVCVLMDDVLKKHKATVELADHSPDLTFHKMRFEARFTIQGNHGEQISRIKVLAANPRTARGFSGDLILDEFAFHENSAAIWEAAEPILAANKDFLCRIASTGNGRHNLFYRMASPAFSPSPATQERGRDGEGVYVSRMIAMADKEISASSPLPSPPLCGGEGIEHLEKADTPGISCSSHSPLPTSSPESLAKVDPHSALMLSKAGFVLSRVTRTQAHAMGVKIFDTATRDEILPEDARARALDKRAYDQNYECAFADENLTLLSHGLISAAEREDIGEISEQDWTPSQLAMLRAAQGQLFAGFDVARRGDLSVITVLEKLGDLHLVRAILRMRDLRLPDQQTRLGEICRLPKFQRAAIDMTGLGLGLYEFAQREFGAGRIHGINFASAVATTQAIANEGRKKPKVRVTEALALELLQCYEDRRIQHPVDARLRDDLRKPGKITTPGGRVSIAATRDAAGHADHFWSLALAIEAASNASAPFAYQAVERKYKRTSLI